jgi:PhnB protein
MLVQPYLFFDGRCEEALEFYRRALGAEVEMLMRYKEAPEPPPPNTVHPGMDERVMHARVRMGDSIVMAADDCTGRTKRFEGVQLTLTAADTAQAERWFNALADGGQVTMPLGKTFFAPSFGMLSDRFGMAWMVIVPE